jgi:SAM-dependent methyltransferase
MNLSVSFRAAIAKVVGQKPLRGFAELRGYFEGKHGLEIGGASELFQSRSLLPVYPIAAVIDNCNFATVTTWQKGAQDSRYTAQFICEATDLRNVNDGSYDFVISSHVIEHIANPLKALIEWKRVSCKDGVILVVCPDGRKTFDHKRPITPLLHLIEDYKQNVDEHDLTHLAEVLAKHDLSLDPPAGTYEEFKLRTENNFENRCLHHHVFVPRSWSDIFDYLRMKTLLIESARPFHIVAVGKKT